MRISLRQASDILAKTEDEVMFIVQDNRLPSHISEDESTIGWEFELEDVLHVKKELDEGLDGQLKQLLTEG